MTPEEQALCERLTAETVVRDGIRLARITTPTDLEAAALIRKLADENDKMARALRAAEMHIRGLSTKKGSEYQSFTIHHNDALKIARER